jgi:prepilin-type N-terminal cleavage/methylation domain-containing protein
VKKGFTLIELLIVVAIIAILAAIAVPNFLEAQIRSKVSRVKNDQRTYATGLESYFVDNNLYPSHSRQGSGTIAGTPTAATPNGGVAINPTAEANNYNAIVGGPAGTPNAELAKQYTFAMHNPASTSMRGHTLTTPVSYLTSLFSDPFMDARGATFYYFANPQGWIIWSPGPDTDQATGGDLGGTGVPAVETIYSTFVSQPSQQLLAGAPAAGGGGAFTYDSTNGTVSQGDVYRVKQ